MLKKGKSNSWYSIISFSIFKIRRSMAVWVLVLLSLVLFGAIAITLFLSSTNIYDFLKNFQYGVFIFNNILLLLFVLLVIIKIFGREFEDGTYLLLISKPYSRFTLFFLKLISLWILIIFFLGTIILFALGIGYIGYLINNDPQYLQVYQNLLLKLFLYSLALSFFASSGILFAVTFLNSQVVLLIVVIFCSLFLVGGMPYSLIMSLANTIDLSFVGTNMTKQPYPVHIIKSTINFKRNLEKKLIKYDNLTSKIWDFYNSWDYDDLDKVFKTRDYENITGDPTFRIKRLEFYQSLGLTKPKESSYTISQLNKWDKITKYKYDNKDETIFEIINKVGGSNLQMKVNFATNFFFKSPGELDSNNEIHQELLDAINFIGRSAKSWDLYLRINDLNVNSLFYFDLDKSYYSLSSSDRKVVTEERKLSEPNRFNPVNVFRSEFARTGISPFDSKYDNGTEFQDWILNYFGAEDRIEDGFEIKTLYVLRKIEINILKKIMDYKLLEGVPIKINTEWQKYDDLMQTYELISKINIIEHWNQIWTSSLSYVPFWFEPLQRSNIDFSVQNNYLMSYQDLPIALQQDKKVDLDVPPFLNINLLLYVYLGISGLFLINAYLILRRKNIT
ncbi:ABC transporter permease [Spiroplasma endosymbiont of Megaselia nigra]|uniref:ABC transporter permease n=1 Tax=Spiroplasma endosymbiont of Megaselia nigra TaxID=2478537 RepID=UPI000F872E5B|nr:ABC transporter permease [Spiroplasma endosymbiont of Megaselia nigra]RUO86109.1 ABC transporter permease [Spiroplasma endosymbiont of Megaselia nigra]